MVAQYEQNPFNAAAAPVERCVLAHRGWAGEIPGLFEHPAFNTLSMPETPSDGRILDIKHATVYRGDTCVFDNLSFVLEADQHTAILGPNGAGKSTILKLLAGEVHAMPKDDTSIRLFGEERWNVWDVRKRLGMDYSKLLTASLRMRDALGCDPYGRTVLQLSAGSQINFPTCWRRSCRQW